MRFGGLFRGYVLYPIWSDGKKEKDSQLAAAVYIGHVNRLHSLDGATGFSSVGNLLTSASYYLLSCTRLPATIRIGLVVLSLWVVYKAGVRRCR